MSTEAVLDFGTQANFVTLMTTENLWDSTTNQPITSKTFRDGSSIFINVVGTTYTNTGTPTAPVWTANAGYWVRIRWNTDDNNTIGNHTLGQIKTYLINHGVTIYPLVKYQADGVTIISSYTCPPWAEIL